MPILQSESFIDSETRSTPDPCNSSVRAFLDQFDHDLRTPLSTMTAVVEFLRDGSSHPTRHAESIAVLERQITRLHALTETLRDFSQRLDRRPEQPRGS